MSFQGPIEGASVIPGPIRFYVVYNVIPGPIVVVYNVIPGPVLGDNVIPRPIVGRAGNSLIRSSLICSFAHFTQIKWVTVSDSLRSLKTNQRPWAICSGRSEEMSNVSESLILLTKNERMSDLLKQFWQNKI